MLIGHWRALICAPACSKARGRHPSSRTSSFRSASFSATLLPHRVRRNLLASCSENAKMSTHWFASRSMDWFTTFDSRLVVSRIWPFACLLHRPDRILCICSDRWSWSTSSSTKSHGFVCFDIHVRTLDNVKSKESAHIPKRNARSFMEFSNFLSFSIEIQNTPPS